jgi:hypothetical protein
MHAQLNVASAMKSRPTAYGECSAVEILGNGHAAILMELINAELFIPRDPLALNAFRNHLH